MSNVISLEAHAAKEQCCGSLSWKTGLARNPAELPARPANDKAGQNLDVHFGSKDLDHPPYRPDFAPSGIYVFLLEATLVLSLFRLRLNAQGVTVTWLTQQITPFICVRDGQTS